MLPQWTTTEFERLSWHDCHVHGLRLDEVKEDYVTAELEFTLELTNTFRTNVIVEVEKGFENLANTGNGASYGSPCSLRARGN